MFKSNESTEQHNVHIHKNQCSFDKFTCFVLQKFNNAVLHGPTPTTTVPSKKILR